jgi:catechol 2,3-dioxygenase-like lactoylglutathione lyase family enzyme
MITGTHAIVFTTDAERARAFLRDVLGLASIDAGGGWQIFRLPPAELAPHPADEPTPPELYLMCDDIEATVHELEVGGLDREAQALAGERAVRRTASRAVTVLPRRLRLESRAISFMAPSPRMCPLWGNGSAQRCRFRLVRA